VDHRARSAKGNGNGWMHQEMGSQGDGAARLVPGGQWGREQPQRFEGKSPSRGQITQDRAMAPGWAVLRHEAKRQSPAPGSLKNLNGAGDRRPCSSTIDSVDSRKSACITKGSSGGEPNPSASGSFTLTI